MSRDTDYRESKRALAANTSLLLFRGICSSALAITCYTGRRCADTGKRDVLLARPFERPNSHRERFEEKERCGEVEYGIAAPARRDPSIAVARTAE